MTTKDSECFDLVGEAYDIIRTIQDPEKIESLEDLNVVREEFVDVSRIGDNEFLIRIEFVPTVPHCSLATLIGLCIRSKLQENLLCNFKLDISVQKGNHYNADDVTKQINDKERTAAALENPELMKIVKQCIKNTPY